MGFACVITVPEAGDEAWTVQAWFKERNDWIERGEVIALLSIAGALHELVSNMPGVLREVEVLAGETAPPGRAAFMIEADGDEIPYGRAYVSSVLRVSEAHD